jgi:hypothetical protein
MNEKCQSSFYLLPSTLEQQNQIKLDKSMPFIKEAEGDKYLLHFHHSELKKILDDFLISMHEIRSNVTWN